MKLVVIDIETTGRTPGFHQILEIAAVLLDTETCSKVAVDDMPYIDLVIKHDSIHGDPAALVMNADLISIIAGEKTPRAAQQVIFPKDMIMHLCDFIVSYGFDVSTHGDQVVINAAGKNVGSFDKLFIEALADGEIVIRSRVFDPATVYTRADDSIMPDLAECARRAGVRARSSHRALDDARTVADLICKMYEQE